MSDAPVTPLNPAIEPQTPDFRQVPHNIEAEQGLLGALLINNDALDQVAEFLKPAYFHDPVHQRRMAFFVIRHDHGVLVVAWPDVFHFAVFR